MEPPPTAKSASARRSPVEGRRGDSRLRRADLPRRQGWFAGGLAGAGQFTDDAAIGAG